ncbi:MAG TPA: hypothetical protein VIC51_01280 [Psychromonas sp.]
MKNTLLASALIAASFLSPSLTAQEDTCPIVAEYAHKIMKDRQGGVSMVKMMQANDKDNGDFYNLVRDQIIEAYSVNYWATPTFKNRAISKFENKWYLACITAK